MKPARSNNLDHDWRHDYFRETCGAEAWPQRTATNCCKNSNARCSAAPPVLFTGSNSRANSPRIMSCGKKSTRQSQIGHLDHRVFGPVEAKKIA